MGDFEYNTEEIETLEQKVERLSTELQKSEERKDQLEQLLANAMNGLNELGFQVSRQGVNIQEFVRTILNKKNE